MGSAGRYRRHTGVVHLHILFCNSERSSVTQAVIGGLLGIVAYELAAVCGAFMGSMGKDPMVGLVLGWTVIAFVSVLRVRANPK